MRKSDEKTIDFRDFLAELLRRWKTVLIITLVFTVLAAGFAKAMISSRRKQAAAEAGKNKETKETIMKMIPETVESKYALSITVPVWSLFPAMLPTTLEPEARDITLSYEMFVDGSMNIFAHKSNVNMKNRIIGF